MNASKVSPSADSCSINVYRFRFDAAALTDESNDSVSMFWSFCRWLHGADTFQVSLSIFSHCFVVETLNLELYRYDLNLITSTAGPNDPIGMFQVVSTWLHDSRTSAVSLFDFLHLADFCSFGLEPSALTSTPSGSVRAFCVVDRWPRRHWQVAVSGSLIPVHMLTICSQQRCIHSP